MQSFSEDTNQPSASGTRKPAVARGRPATLSTQKVIEATRRLLRHTPTDDISLAAIARELKCTTVALYHYFPSRDALFEAVANDIFHDFPIQDLIGENWQNNLLHWCQSLAHFFERDPAVTRAMAWDGRVSGPWLRAQGPVFELLYDLGLRGAALIETLTWFSGAIVGVLRTHVMSLETKSGIKAFDLNTDAAIGYLSDKQQAIILEADERRRDICPEHMLHEAFTTMISALHLSILRQTLGKNTSSTETEPSATSVNQRFVQP